MAKELTREMLWEAGAQFGHQTKRWNPKMKPYIYGEKNKIHIIDLQQTLWRLEDVKRLMITIVAKKGKVLFVGTKKQAKWLVKDAAERSENFYVNERWLGGTLTNLKTIHLRVKRLWNIERQELNGEIKLLPKKEQILIKKEKDKLEKFLGGIKGMKDLPHALFVVDPKEEHTAVKEAIKLRIPVIAICDTNVDPDGIDYVIPANDDTSRAIAIIVHHIADLYGEAAGLEMPEPQFKPTDFIRREGEENRGGYRGEHNFDRRGGENRSYNREDGKGEYVKKEWKKDFNPRSNRPSGSNNSEAIVSTKVDKEGLMVSKDINVQPIKTAAMSNPVQPVEARKPMTDKTGFDFSKIIVIDNDLEKTFTKLKVDEIENIGQMLGVKKAKKADMIHELKEQLTIIDNQITKK